MLDLSFDHNKTQSLIQEQVSLKDKNWFKTGGAARFFSCPSTPDEFQAALAYANQHTLDLFLLGHGANILISDDGFDGLVIQPRLTSITHTLVPDESTALVTAGAGVSMHDLINYCLDHQLIGLEEFSGIPGTVGGSVYINLHYFEFLLEQFIVSARVVARDGSHICSVERQWFEFGYNKSRLQRGDYYLADATFSLRSVDALTAAHAHGRSQEIIRHRKQRYPNERTCGSFFRNFLPNEVSIESNGKKMIFVAYYLDKLGFKGQLNVGGASVSYQHANMIVTTPGATSSDVIELAKIMQEKVYDAYGIIPQPECRLIGFKKYPLL